MPKLGAEESKNLAKMLEDTSEIDQAVADAGKMSTAAAEEMLNKLGLKFFTNGTATTRLQQLQLAINDAAYHVSSASQCRNPDFRKHLPATSQ